MTVTPTSQRVIFNADDFGRSPSINEAVVRAHREGVLTTASLMVNGEACEEAVDLAKAHPGLGVGLHLTLVMGRATLPSGRIPGLVNERGEFPDNPVAAGFKCFFQRSLRTQLEAEIDAQIDKFAATGLAMDHVNGHLNFHLHPVVFQLLLRRLAQMPARNGAEHGHAVPAVRLTRDPFWLNSRLAGGNWIYRASHAFIYWLLAARSRRLLRTQGIRHARWVFGLLQNAQVDEDYLLGLLPRLPAGDVEIYSHPNLDVFRDEYAALVSPRVLDLIKKLGIRRCRYQDL